MLGRAHAAVHGQRLRKLALMLHFAPRGYIRIVQAALCIPERRVRARAEFVRRSRVSIRAIFAQQRNHMRKSARAFRRKHVERRIAAARKLLAGMTQMAVQTRTPFVEIPVLLIHVHGNKTLIIAAREHGIQYAARDGQHFAHKVPIAAEHKVFVQRKYKVQGEAGYGYIAACRGAQLEQSVLALAKRQQA